MQWKGLYERFARRVAPTVVARRRLRDIQAQFGEDEMRLLPALAARDKVSLDIGASQGDYTAHLVLHSKSVVAFEPRGFDGSELAWIVHSLRLPVTFESVALSDREGEASLRVVSGVEGLSTIEESNRLEYSAPTHVITKRVGTARLDSFGYENVGFIKIDVEGHESAVLEGGVETLKRNRCNLLVECEERHVPGALRKLFDIMAALEYEGYFLMDGQLHAIARFDAAAHQQPANLADWRDGWKRYGVYVLNFIFVHRPHAARFVASSTRLGIPFHG